MSEAGREEGARSREQGAGRESGIRREEEGEGGREHRGGGREVRAVHGSFVQAPFIPSKHEAKQVMRMVMAMRSESYQKSVANRKLQEAKERPNYTCE